MYTLLSIVGHISSKHRRVSALTGSGGCSRVQDKDACPNEFHVDLRANIYSFELH